MGSDSQRGEQVAISLACCIGIKWSGASDWEGGQLVVPTSNMKPQSFCTFRGNNKEHRD